MPVPLTLPVTYGPRKPPLGSPLRGRGTQLAAFYALNEGAGPPRNARPLVQGQSPSLSSGMSWGGGPAGRALVGGGSSDYADTGDTGNHGTPSGTIIFRCYQSWSAGDSLAHCWWGQRNGSETQLFEWQKFSDNNIYVGWYDAGNDTRLIVAANGLTNAVQGTWQTYAYTWDPGGSHIYRFAPSGTNGLLIGTTTVPVVVNIGASMYLGASHNFSGGGMGAGAMLDYLLIDTRRWQEGEIQTFSLAPFAFF